MTRFVLTVSTVLAVTIFSALAESDSQQKAPVQKSQQQKEKQTSMTGCVDQQDGHYVLVDDHELHKIANLEADGFPTEGFAKHVGHKVTVRGTGNASGTVPQFKVRTIETLSETCAPDKAR